MSQTPSMTREEYLQLRKSNAWVLARKLVVPAILAIVACVFVVRTEIQPATVNQLVLFWTMLATAFISFLWFVVLLIKANRLDTVHCPACKKNNGYAKAYQWLVASGTCFYCKEKMLLDSSAMTVNEKPLISRTQFEEYFKLVEAKLSKVALVLGGPLALGLLLLTFYDPHFTSLGNVPTSTGLLIGVPLLTYIGFFIWLSWRIQKNSGVNCNHCGVFPQHTKRIILATGGCPSCGHRMFEN